MFLAGSVQTIAMLLMEVVFLVKLFIVTGVITVISITSNGLGSMFQILSIVLKRLRSF